MFAEYLGVANRLARKFVLVDVLRFGWRELDPGIEAKDDAGRHHAAGFLRALKLKLHVRLPRDRRKANAPKESRNAVDTSILIVLSRSSWLRLRLFDI